MTIEIAPKAPTPHKSGGAEAHAAKAKPQNGAQSASADKAAGKAGADGTTDAGATGFLAILAAMGDASGQGAVDGATDAQSLLISGDGALADEAFGGTDANAGGAITDPAILLAQGAPALPADAAAAARNDADPAKAALAAAMAGSNAGKPAGLGDGGEAAQDGAGRLMQRSHGVAGGAGKHGLAGLSQGKDSQGNGAQSAEGSTDAGAAAGAANSTATAKGEAAPAFDLKMFAAMQEARGSQAAKAPESTVAVAMSATEKRGQERTESAKATTEATYSGAPVGVSSNGYSVGGSADVAPAPDMQAAEQVKYWISQDVQNAELKLDGLGDKPVEVSISINGNEAHVAFRTDEIQTRGVLESAGMHLKDMLAREGLLLSGVSVGTSGANDGGGGERKPRQGMKQGMVNAAPVSGVETANRARGASGRSLDLFV